MAGTTGLEQRRVKVTGSAVRGRGSHEPGRSPTTLIVLVCATLAVVALTQLGPRFLGGRAQPGAASASNERIDMTELKATVTDGKIEVSAATVKEKGLVRFTYKGATEIPLLAYVAPSGKIITAVSMCEPCSSTRFFIQGNKIICSSCGTEWDLESLKGIRGGCTTFPPDKVPNTVDDDVIRIDEAPVAGWKSRI